jgi:hypothetical protein
MEDRTMTTTLPTAQDIMARLDGSRFEHTGGNVYTVYYRHFAMGPFERFGEACDDAIYIQDENLDRFESAMTLDEIVAAMSRLGNP